jgi:hypothetical protein
MAFAPKVSADCHLLIAQKARNFPGSRTFKLRIVLSEIVSDFRADAIAGLPQRHRAGNAHAALQHGPGHHATLRRAQK